LGSLLVFCGSSSYNTPYLLRGIFKCHRMHIFVSNLFPYLKLR